MGADLVVAFGIVGIIRMSAPSLQEAGKSGAALTGSRKRPLPDVTFQENLLSLKCGPIIYSNLRATQKGPMPEKKREELRARRAPLAKRFEDNPNDIHIALEIKAIDDQIAECTRLINRKRRPSSKSLSE